MVWKIITGLLKVICEEKILKKLSITEMQNLAESRNGKCLSDKYVSFVRKLTWECEKGHVWDALPNSIKQGHWCPECARIKRITITIQEMQKLAELNNGKCLSTEYKGRSQKLRWQCSEGHEWEAVPNNIKHLGNWCPYCSKRVKLTIQEMKILAGSRR